MLLEAIFGIIAISVVFCCCTLCCYLLFQFLFDEGKGDEQPEIEAWEARHYYDPLPLSTSSPPDSVFKPTPYTFKLQNGNGVYPAGLPHAVINPAVLQYPPGHILDQQRIPPQPAQQKPSKQNARRHSRSRSRSKSPGPRRAKNVWSTDTDFHQQYNYYKYNNHLSNDSRLDLSHSQEISQEYLHPEEHPVRSFVANTHATNSFSNHQQRYKSRLKEAIT